MGILELIMELQTKLVDAQNAAQVIADEAFAKGKEEGKLEGYNEGYAKGFEDGKNSVPPPVESDKIFSQAEFDAKLAEVVSPLNEQISALQAQVDGISALIDGAKVEAVAAFKVELKAKYEEMQVAESTLETGFGELLN